MKLSSQYYLSDKQIQQYQQDGHIFLSRVSSPKEIAFYRPIIRAAIQKHNTEKRLLIERDTYGKAFLKGMNLWAIDRQVKRYVMSQRFAKIAAELMGVDGVRIYHDQALFKEPGGGHTPWHQDQYYWPLNTDKTITMWMPLVDLTEDMGILTFASGSHHQGYLGTLPISDKSEIVFQAYVDQQGFSLSRRKMMNAGDATFHSGWTLHAAPGNQSAAMREVMTVIYIDANARVSEPINESQINDMARWLPGLKPGDAASSNLNPKVL